MIAARCFYPPCVFGLVSLACGLAQAQLPGKVEPTVQLIAEVRAAPSRAGSSTLPAGQAEPTFEPADRLEQGQEIFYTVRITNPSSQPLSAVTVTLPVPQNTRYIANSAVGAGAVMLYSIDGQQFLDANHLPAATLSPAGHKVLPYTHLRWRFDAPLPPKVVVLARFRAEFN